VGSRSKVDLAYIAGFLDGDGSLMLQIKKRKDGRLKRRFMPTICLYQDSRHEQTLTWMRQLLGIGYLSRRNDNITELRINGYQQVEKILKMLLPFIRFKKIQANALYQASKLLSGNAGRRMTENNLRFLVDCILDIQNNNYVTKKKKTRQELLKILDLTP